MAGGTTTLHESPVSLERSPREPERIRPQISYGRLGTLSAIILAVGSTLSDEKPAPTLTASDRPSSFITTLSIPRNIENTAPSGEDTVEDFRTNANTFTCHFGSRDITGSLTEGGSITTVQFDNLTITLTQPISPESLERFLRSATGTATLLATRGTVPEEHLLTASGSARFQFTKKHGETSSLWVATSHDILQVDAVQELERERALHQWKTLVGMISEHTDLQEQMVDQRLQVHNTRMHTTYDDLTSRLEQYHPRSYERYYWQERRNEFVYEWNTISEQWESASQPERRALLSAFHTHLARWEEWLSLHPEMEAETSFSSRYQKLSEEITTLQGEARVSRNGANKRLLHDPIHQTIITEQSSLLSPKNFTREHRANTGLLLRHQTYEDDVLTKETEYDAAGKSKKEHALHYFPGGQLRRVQENAPKDGTLTLQRQTDYWRNGNTRAVLDMRSDAFAYFGERGGLIYEDVARSTPTKRQRGMVDAQGNRFGLYRDEKTNNATLTPSQYIDMLAQKLDTEEKLAVFFEQFLWYASDNGDHWQTAEETVQRVEEYDGKGSRYMRGDCDDYAFLARDILRRQGKNAHVIYVPGHAICVWIETDAEGEYHARAEDTSGFDHNGNRYGPDFRRDPGKAKGYTRLIDAFNSLMTKYKGWGEALENYTFDENAIWLMPNPPAGTYNAVTADYFLRKVS